jgi:glycosyltransferase involved in cell wall biosynthesis
MSTLSQTLLTSKNNNIMILVPFCDQGLGIQGRNYYNILKHNGYNPSIFSYKPYTAKSTLELQKDPQEWSVDKVYYSPHDREHVKDEELLDFINKNNIGKCIIPEACWFRIFEIAKLLRNNNVKCYCIPNIEITRKDEISKHKYFYKILCNNLLCEQIFNKYGITNTKYIGYGLDNTNITFMPKPNDSPLKFLFVGGINSFSRKHILEICEAFILAYEQNQNIQLTCTIQKINCFEIDDIKKLKKYLDHPAITFIQDHLPYKSIINLYYTHHISVQVSKHEGLGLGFYEALASGTPVISLNTPPHNEIVKDNINGFIINCFYKKMTDNNDSFIESAYFDPVLLCNKILEIVNNKDMLPNMYKTLIDDYNKNFTSEIFIDRFIKAL